MSIIMELKIEDGNVVGKLKQAEKGIKGLDKVGKKAATGGLKNLTKSVAGLATAFVGFRAIKDIARVGVDFDTTMRKVKAVSKATEKEMQTLTKTARHLGKTTTFTASQVGDLEHEMAKLGFTAKQINAAAEGVLYMAQATGSDLAQAAEVAGNVLRGFNIDAKDTMRVSDVMAMSFTSSALNISRFAESMKYAAPVAASLGVSLEETTAIMGELANRGISGSLAGTALRNVMLRLAGTTSDASKKLGGMSLQTHTLTEIFDKLHEMGIGAAEAQKLFGLRSASAAAILMNIGGPALEAFTEKLEKSGGAAKEMAEVKMGGWAGKIRELSSAFESFQITLFNALAGKGGAIVLLTEVIRLWDSWLSKISGKMTEVESLELVLTQYKSTLAAQETGVQGYGIYALHVPEMSLEAIEVLKENIRITEQALERADFAKMMEEINTAGKDIVGTPDIPGGPLGGGGLPEPPDIISREDFDKKLAKMDMAYQKMANKAKENPFFAQLAEEAAFFDATLDDLLKTEEKFLAKMELLENVARDFGFAIGAGLTGGLGDMKDSLKQTLILLVNYLEKLALAGLAAAGFKSLFGDYGAMAKYLAVAAAFEVAKGAISSWSGGGVVSEAVNGRISSGGMVSGPGHGTSDSILAQISTGEAILNARAVRNLGADRINYINRSGELPSYAKGGIPSSRVENYVGNVYYNFGKTSADPFTVFRTHRDFVRSRRGTSSLRTTR